MYLLFPSIKPASFAEPPRLLPHFIYTALQVSPPIVLAFPDPLPTIMSILLDSALFLKSTYLTLPNTFFIC